MGLGWLSDPADPRVVAALLHTCPSCKAKPSRRCGLSGETPTGIVHQIRIPEDVLFEVTP